MSLIALAEFLDLLVEKHGVFLEETETTITVTNLSATDAEKVYNDAIALQWRTTVFDDAAGEVTSEKLDPEYEPFRAVIYKPAAPQGVFQILTNTCFESYLYKGHGTNQWQIARLSKPILTQGRLLAPWGTSEEFQPNIKTKSPRELVREYGTTRHVPLDIKPWLLCEEDIEEFDDSVVQVWVSVAIDLLLKSLASEVDVENKIVWYNGPPRCRASFPSDFENSAINLGKKGFLDLQAAAKWVFESPRDTEMRHTLLVTEFSRCGINDSDIITCVKNNLFQALDSAKIAYQFGVSELSGEAQKALVQLRQSVMSETAKLTEITGKLSSAMAGALAVGIGLIAARLTTDAPPMLLKAIMSVVVLYVIMVSVAGLRFALTQIQMRKQWKFQIPNFLSDQQYNDLVETPSTKMMNTYFVVAFIGLFAVLILTFYVFIAS